MWVWFVALFGLLVESSLTQLQSPCPQLFRYLHEKPGQWDGEVTLKTDSELHGVWVRLLFDKPSKQLEVADDFGEIVSTDNVGYLLKNRNFILKTEEPTKVRISMKYEGDQAPKLIGFRLNARTVCPDHGGEFGWTEGTKDQSNEFFLGDLSNKDFLATRPITNSIPHCGTTPLFPNNSGKGKTTEEGQWPWHASVYLSKGNQQKRVCSATLISPNHLITAAHCVSPKNSPAALQTDVLKIHLGEHFTAAENKGLQDAHVAEVVLHPGYNPINLDNDVAIIKLDKAVVITDYVRPVCLWEESAAVQSVFRREGVVVGLSFDNEGRFSDRLTHAQLQVASPDLCANANPGISAFLSSRALCARYTKGNNLCTGESGTGYGFLSEDAKPVWHLRGLVTLGAALQDKSVCNENTYVVIADLAQHTSWIKATIS